MSISKWNYFFICLNIIYLWILFYACDYVFNNVGLSSSIYRYLYKYIIYSLITPTHSQIFI